MLDAVNRSWEAASKKRAVTRPAGSSMSVPGWGIPYRRRIIACRSAGARSGFISSFRRPNSRMVAEPSSDSSENVMPWAVANAARLAAGS